jgi:hypothetical protein
MAKTKAMIMREQYKKYSYCLPYSKKATPSMCGVKRRRIVLKRSNKVNLLKKISLN